ncbi:MAG: hypothetical protein IKQ72_05930 [Bacteroidaceae bacterium]|nr:hypothetical protein [Bacteroidaceae bacterium]
MNKIYLTKRAKEILRLLNEKKYKLSDNDKDDLILLEIEGLGSGKKLVGQSYCTFIITEKGKAYIYSNPRLRNPSIWDDKKYIINTIISVISIIISIIAICKK